MDQYKGTGKRGGLAGLLGVGIGACISGRCGSHGHGRAINFAILSPGIITGRLSICCCFCIFNQHNLSVYCMLFCYRSKTPHVDTKLQINQL